MTNPSLPSRKNGGITRTNAEEDRARKILIDAGILNVSQRCPYCGRYLVGSVRRDRFRCRDCGKEWGLKKGSILEETRISYKTFLNLVRLFAADVPVNDAANRLGIAKNTAYDMYSRIRTTLPGNNNAGGIDKVRRNDRDTGSGTAGPAGELVAAEAPDHAVMFGIRLQNGMIVIEPVIIPDSDVITALPVPTMQRGNILFIDAYGKKYQGFITYNTGRKGREIVRIRPRESLPWSPLSEFWTFTLQSWARRRGVDRKNIPEFVRELAFRFNHRHTDLFPVILETIARAADGSDPPAEAR